MPFPMSMEFWKKQFYATEHVAFLMLSKAGSVVAFPNSPTPEFLGVVSWMKMVLEEIED